MCYGPTNKERERERVRKKSKERVREVIGKSLARCLNVKKKRIKK